MSSSDEEDFDEKINPFEGKNAREKEQVYFKLLTSEVYVNDKKRLEILNKQYTDAKNPQSYLSNMQDHDESKNMPAMKLDHQANKTHNDDNSEM